jgi:hypothetical protein
MKTYKCTVLIEAASPAEVEMKMKALTILAAKLKANELDKLAEVVENNPVKTALAKKYLGL